MQHKNGKAEHSDDVYKVSSEAKKYLTSREVKELRETTDRLEKFLKLLEELKADLQRSTKFEESYKVIVKFVSDSRRTFGKSDDRIWTMVKQLDSVAYDMYKNMIKMQKDAKTLIEETVKLYNREFHSDIVFGGDRDVAQWLNRNLSLMELYVNKKLKEDNPDE